MNGEKNISFPRVVFMSHLMDCSDILQLCKDKKKHNCNNKDDEYDQQLRVLALIERKLKETTMFANIKVESDTYCTNDAH